MKFGVALGALNPHFHLDATIAAEELGYESVWLPEHLVFTRAMSRSPHPGEDAPAGPARHADLRRVRVPRASSRAAPNACGSARTCSTSGCAIRSRPRAACRPSTSLSNGRFEFGIGASWLEEEWDADAARLRDARPPGRRGDRGVQAALDRGDDHAPRRVLLVRRGRVRAEAACSSRGRRSSSAASRRPRCAARPASATAGSAWRTRSSRRAAQIATLRALLGGVRPRAATASRSCSAVRSRRVDDVRRWEDIGVTRMIVSPWRRSPEAVEAMQRFADTVRSALAMSRDRRDDRRGGVGGPGGRGGERRRSSAPSIGDRSDRHRARPRRRRRRPARRHRDAGAGTDASGYAFSVHVRDTRRSGDRRELEDTAPTQIEWFLDTDLTVMPDAVAGSTPTAAGRLHAIMERYSDQFEFCTGSGSYTARHDYLARFRSAVSPGSSSSGGR